MNKFYFLIIIVSGILSHNQSQNYTNHNHYLDDTYRSAAFYKWYRKGKENKNSKEIRQKMLQNNRSLAERN
jgi:hypothetical protein